MLLSLPNELVWMLLEYGDSADLMEIRFLCKEFYSLSNQFAQRFLKYLHKEHSLNIPEGFGGSRSATCLLNFILKPRGFLLGGGSLFEGKDSFLNCHLYNFRQKQWSSLPSLSTAHGMIKTEAIGTINGVYVIGGEDPSSANTIEFYSIFTGTWMTLPPIPVTLTYASAALLPSCNSNSVSVSSSLSSAVSFPSSSSSSLVIAGGLVMGSMEYNTHTYTYHLATNTWSEPTEPLLPSSQSSIHQGRYGHDCCALGDGNDGEQMMMMVGGKTLDTFTSSTEIYCTLTKTWRKGPSLTKPRMWTRLLNMQGILYAIGGDVDEQGTGKYPTIERYIAGKGEGKGKWEYVTELPRMRKIFTATANSQRGLLYMIGGKDEYYGSVRKVDVYDVKKGRWIEEEQEEEEKEIVEEAVEEGIEEEKGEEGEEESLIKSNSKRWCYLPREKFCGGQAILLPPNHLSYSH